MGKEWCRLPDLNWRPTAYKADKNPLFSMPIPTKRLEIGARFLRVAGDCRKIIYPMALAKSIQRTHRNPESHPGIADHTRTASVG
jgi:hypothetical protein